MRPAHKTFELQQAIRNAQTLKLYAVLTAIFYGGFWILDWVVVPRYVLVTLAMRVSSIVFGGALFWACRYRRRFVVDYHYALTVILALSMCWGIAVMSWLHQGLESPYYAGDAMVALVILMSCSWSIRQAVLFAALVYGFYVLPLALRLIPVRDFPVMVSNQFFFVSLLILPIVAQRHRVALELREFNQKKTLKSYLAQVRAIATQDPLTAINNRRHLLTLGESEWKRCDRYKRPFSVIIADIDLFKRVNDTYTHRVGDEVIRGVADILVKSVRAIDIVGRYGGEEFVVIVPEADGAQAAQVIAQRIQDMLRSAPLQTSAGPLPISLSMGVCGNDLEPGDLPTLINRADVALYRAKEGGRNRVEAWLPADKATLPS